MLKFKHSALLLFYFTRFNVYCVTCSAARTCCRRCQKIGYTLKHGLVETYARVTRLSTCLRMHNGPISQWAHQGRSQEMRGKGAFSIQAHSRETDIVCGRFQVEITTTQLFFLSTAKAQIPVGSSVVTSRHDATRSTGRASRAPHDERVEPCCSTSSTQPKCMGSTRRTCRVVSRRDATSQVKFGLKWARVHLGGSERGGGKFSASKPTPGHVAFKPRW